MPTNLPALSVADLNTTINHEPRVNDALVARQLGFARLRAVRQIIERNRPELEAYGSLATRRGESRGQAFDEYFLNEGQALVICALSRTERAAEVRRALIEVFMAWRRGQLAPPTPESRSIAVRAHLRRLRDYRTDPAQLALPVPIPRAGMGIVQIGDGLIRFSIHATLRDGDRVLYAGRHGLEVGTFRGYPDDTAYNAENRWVLITDDDPRPGELYSRLIVKLIGKVIR